MTTANDEMMRMLDACARLGDENAALRALLREWYELFAPVRREGTEGARLLDRTAQALVLRSSEKRTKVNTTDTTTDATPDGAASALAAGLERLSDVPCGGCTLCCHNDAVRLLPSDDPSQYQTEPHPYMATH